MKTPPTHLRRCAIAMRATALSLSLLSSACGAPQPASLAEAPSPPHTKSRIPPLPMPVSNNAVAGLRVGNSTRVYSFMGLTTGKTHTDIVRAAFEYDSVDGVWRRLPDVPVSEGRLASVAATAGDAVFLFGGYSVAADGHEVSTPDVLRFDPSDKTYRRVAPMPTPVDDSVALTLEDRWIYLVSGWHQDRNLPLVQVYDSREDRWERATDYPGIPVFGHSGAIQGRELLICDGVRLDIIAGKRTFTASAECWRGTIDSSNPQVIAWRKTASHPGAPRYRMAAAADARSGAWLFLAGSENPYNFNGIGYDGRPSPASAQAQAYDLASERWRTLAPLPQASMDHRGLVAIDGRYAILGGMREGQRVSAEVMTYAPTETAPEAVAPASDKPSQAKDSGSSPPRTAR